MTNPAKVWQNGETRTVNISLTDKQLKETEKMTKDLGFANRSEFFRTVLRYLFRKPEVLEEITTFPFISPDTKSTKEVLESFKTTGKYSKGFLKDLKEGLRESDYFTK